MLTAGDVERIAASLGSGGPVAVIGEGMDFAAYQCDDLVFRVAKRDEVAALVEADAIASLGGLWIAPPDSGAGFAEELIGEVVRWALEQGAAALRLYVTEGNTRAEGVYRRVGFSRTGQMEIRSRDSATEVEMRLRISHDERPGPTR